MYDDYGNWIPGSDESGDVIVDDAPPDDLGDAPPARDWQDNGDGTQTDLNSAEIWADGVLIGYDNFDGTFVGIDDSIRDYQGNVIGTMTPDGPYYNNGAAPATSSSGKGIFSGLGDFFSGLFGGGSGNSLAQGAGAVASQMARQIAQARAAGAPASTIAAMQRQLAGQLGAMRGPDMGQTILVAAAVGLGVYALSRRNK